MTASRPGLGARLRCSCGRWPAARPTTPVAEPPVPSSPPATSARRRRPRRRPRPPPASPAAPDAEPGHRPAAWLGTRPLPLRADGYGQARPTPPELRPAPVHAARHGAAAARRRVRVAGRARSRPTCWPGRPGSPGARSAADELAWVRLTFWGFDDQRHTGELLVNRSVADDLVRSSASSTARGSPSRSSGSPRRAELDARPTGDGNDTGAFVCRPTTGSTTTFSQHAYGLAIDLDPFQNPYVKGDLVLPELASAYLDRDDARPGMITPDGVVVRAFARSAGVGRDW